MTFSTLHYFLLTLLALHVKMRAVAKDQHSYQ